MNTSFKKTTLITGASGGIGYELAFICASSNQDLLLVARSTEKLKAVKAEIEKHFPVNVTVLRLDLSETGAAKTVVEFVKNKYWLSIT